MMRKWVIAILLGVSVSGCAAALLGNASRGGYYGGSAQTQDGTLTSAVKSKLAADATLKGQAVVVETHDAVVTLRGTVQKAEQRATAERLARSVKGVKNVRNELKTR